MARTLILGGGKVGRAAAQLLHETGEYDVTVGDASQKSLDLIKINVKKQLVNAGDAKDLDKTLAGFDYVISTCPFFLNEGIAKAAHKHEVNYFDVTEDVETTRAIRELSKTGSAAFAPQCGLAPGFISIAAHGVAQKFETLQDVNLRVGALPETPTNSLKYNLTWSTEGLINEYCNPCEAIVEGKMTEVQPLESLEHFTLDNHEYEAFNTSGGIGSLTETLKGKVKNLNYKTIRYPGHRDQMKLLLLDLRLIDRRDLLKEIFEHALPTTKQDVVIVFVKVSGKKDGEFQQENFSRKIDRKSVV